MFCWLHTKSCRRFNSATFSWRTSWQLSRGCSQKDVNLSWEILDTWPNHRSWDLSIRWSSSTLRRYASRSCAHSRKVSRRGLIANFLAVEITLFWSLSKVNDRRWGSGQRPISKLKALRCLKVPVLSPQSDEAHAELSLIYQSV